MRRGVAGPSGDKVRAECWNGVVMGIPPRICSGLLDRSFSRDPSILLESSSPGGVATPAASPHPFQPPARFKTPGFLVRGQHTRLRRPRMALHSRRHLLPHPPPPPPPHTALAKYRTFGGITVTTSRTVPRYPGPRHRCSPLPPPRSF